MLQKILTLLFVLILTPAALSANEWDMAEDAYQDQDYAAALSIWKRLAEDGDADAQYAVGIIYFRGQGVRSDLETALGWFKKAADSGHPKAIFNLGVASWNGKGVRKSYADAVKWWKKGAEKNDPPSQYNLGLAYFLGKGAEQDYEQANKWISLAAQNGHERAGRVLPTVQEKIGNNVSDTPDDRRPQTATKTATLSEDTTTPPAGPEVETLSETAGKDEPQAGYGAAIVTKAGVALRIEPKSSATVLDTMESGTPIKIHSSADGWALVEVPAGTLVWVFGKYITGVSDNAKIRGAGVRARSRPGTERSSKILTRFKGGEKVRILATRGKWKLVSVAIKTWLPAGSFEMLETPTKAWQSDWKIALERRSDNHKRSGRTAKRATESQNVPVDESVVKPRAALARPRSSEVLGTAHPEAPVLALITKGTPVRVLTDRGAYVSVQIPNGLAVWVYDKLLDNRGKIAVVNTHNARARSMPSTGVDSNVLGHFKKGNRVLVISRQGEWTRLRALDSVAGWMRRDQLQILDTVTAEWTEKWSRARASIRQ